MKKVWYVSGVTVCLILVFIFAGSWSWSWSWSWSADVGLEDLFSKTQELDVYPQSGKLAANQFIREKLNAVNFQNYSDKEKALYLNAVVFNFCENKQPHIQNLDSLFVNCNTACGGYSYVLRGLLESEGIKTRYINFYNIPNQGNHTGVEAWINDRWAFLDPTFGAFFTENRHFESRIVDAQELNWLLAQGKTEDIGVWSVEKGKYKSENFIYNDSFERPYMYVENYGMAENVSELNPDNKVMFSLNVSLKGDHVIFGDVQSKDFQSLDQNFLSSTNKTLLDDNLSNNTSYLFSRISDNLNYSPVHSINIGNVNRGKKYKVKMRFYVDHGRPDISVIGDGLTMVIGEKYIDDISHNVKDIVFPFVSKKNDVKFLISSNEGGNNTRFFGIIVEEDM